MIPKRVKNFTYPKLLFLCLLTLIPRMNVHAKEERGIDKSVIQVKKLEVASQSHEENLSLIHFFIALCTNDNGHNFSQELPLDMIKGYDKNLPLDRQSKIFERDNLLISLIPDSANQTEVANCANLLDKILQDSKLVEKISMMNLRNKNLNFLPESIKYFTNLSVLDVTNNNLSTLPDSLKQLHLHILYIAKNKFVTVPESVSRIAGLASLDISFNPITSPLNFSNFRHFQFLTIDNSQKNLVPTEKEVNNIPVTITGGEKGPIHKSIRWIHQNKIPIPNRSYEENLSIIHFYIALCHKGDEKSPFSLTNFAREIPLDKVKGYDQSIPIHQQSAIFSKENLLASFIPDIQNKEAIANSAHMLETLLRDLACNKGLWQLDLSNKNLDSIPEAIKYFIELRALYLAGNNLSSLPDVIKDMDFITLDIRKNNFTSIPNVLLKKGNLHFLDISYNPFSQSTKLPSLSHINLSIDPTQRNILPDNIYQSSVRIVDQEGREIR